MMDLNIDVRLTR